MNKNYIIMVIAAGIVVLIVLDQILKGLGIKKSKEKFDRGEDAISLATMKEFNPLYYRDVTFKQLAPEVAKTYAIDAKKAMRGFFTDEDALNAVFGKLMNKTQISQISEQYHLKYKDDLLGDILGELRTEKEKAELFAIIKTLPNV